MSNSENEPDLLFNAEIFVLEKLLAKQYFGVDPSIDINDLMDFVEPGMSPLVDQVIKDLVAQSLTHSPDGKNYIITPEGIGELEYGKKEAILLYLPKPFFQ